MKIDKKVNKRIEDAQTEKKINNRIGGDTSEKNSYHNATANMTNKAVNQSTPSENQKPISEKQDIANIIKSTRKSLNISQKTLSEQAGIKYQILQRMESGKTNFQIDTLLKVTTALGIGLIILKSISKIGGNNGK